MIREAKFGDIPALAILMQEMYARSIYVGRAELEDKDVKALFLHTIKKHGSPYQGGTYFMVSEDKQGCVNGFIIGMLDTIYQVSNKFTATDLFFYVSPKASKLAAGKLIDAFLTWAEAHPKVIEIYMGATNAIEDYKRTSKLYTRKGLQQCGVIYEKRITKDV